MICGIQKTTLIDYPGKIACTIFFYGCNFRCGFCYNPELVIEKPGKIFSEKDILDFLNQRKNKLEGVCITGGEPLLNLSEDFLRKIKELDYSIKIDTNGTNPKKLKELIDEGLIDYVAMDIKGAKEDYSLIANANVNIKDIEESIKIISGLSEYEFRTTVLEEFHDKEKIISIGEWINSLSIKKPRKYFLQGFKNNGKFIDKKFKNSLNVSENYLNLLRKEAEPYFQEVGIRW